MLRNILCAVFVLAVSFGIVAAETHKGKITKIEGNKITITNKDKESKTLEAAKDVKVYKMDGKEKAAVKGGLADLEVGKGLGATVITNDDNKVTEIILGGGKKKKTDN